METAPPTQRGDQAGRDTPLSPHRPGARGGPGPTEDINRGVSTSTSPPLSVERTQKELEGGEGETESTAAQMQAQTAAGRRAETVGKEGGRRGGRRGEGGGGREGGTGEIEGRARAAPSPLQPRRTTACGTRTLRAIRRGLETPVLHGAVGTQPMSISIRPRFGRAWGYLALPCATRIYSS
jgi:hypothetical protein